MKIEQDSSKYSITLGVACSKSPKALTTPLTFEFDAGSFKNLKAIEAKLAALQNHTACLTPGERARLQNEAMRIEAFTTSKFEEVFHGKPEPTDEEQRLIIFQPSFEITDSAHLVMKNTFNARRNALESARQRIKDGNPIWSEELIKAIQGDIYSGFNDFCDFESRYQRGYITTGGYKCNMNGADNFKTAHPTVIPVFMQDLVEFLNSETAQKMHPLLLGIVAHFMFVQIHPFDDGNGRTSRIIYDICASCYDGGKYNLRDMVSISECYDKQKFVGAIFRYAKPSPSGRIDMNYYISEVGKMLEGSLDKALERAGIKETERRR